MLKLALKEATILVDVEDEDHPELRMRMTTLADADVALMLHSKTTPSNAGDDEVAIEVSFPVGELIPYFGAQFVGFEGEDVLIGDDEVPFDPANVHHVNSIPLVWKMTAMGELISYATTLGASAKNSKAQVTLLDEDTTPSKEV